MRRTACVVRLKIYSLKTLEQPEEGILEITGRKRPKSYNLELATYSENFKFYLGIETIPVNHTVFSFRLIQVNLWQLQLQECFLNVYGSE